MRQQFFEYGPSPSSYASTQGTRIPLGIQVTPGMPATHISPVTGPFPGWPGDSSDPRLLSYGYANPQHISGIVPSAEHFNPYMNSVGYSAGYSASYPTLPNAHGYGTGNPYPRGMPCPRRPARGAPWSGHLSQGNRDSRMTHPARPVAPFQSTRGVPPINRYHRGHTHHHGTHRGAYSAAQQPNQMPVDYYNVPAFPQPHLGQDHRVQAPIQRSLNVPAAVAQPSNQMPVDYYNVPAFPQPQVGQDHRVQAPIQPSLNVPAAVAQPSKPGIAPRPARPRRGQHNSRVRPVRAEDPPRISRAHQLACRSVAGPTAVIVLPTPDELLCDPVSDSPQDTADASTWTSTQTAGTDGGTAPPATDPANRAKAIKTWY
ncbi:hypothetical protein BR93DRAFT_964609 [Coniochaeta sp. PMI_546]|nr:hypothetical protein BR93DRAFT_964609 [Coniochaeta sp. PMI_546]